MKLKARLYANMIRLGRMTLEDVPEEYRAAVEAALC